MEEESSDFHSYSSYNDSDTSPVVVDDEDESNPTKPRKICSHIIHHHPIQSGSSQIKWRSHDEQLIYSSKLVRALQYVLRRNPTKPNASRYIREAAERVLAATAKGRTRWSRAILSNPFGGGPKFGMVYGRQKVKKVTVNGRLKKSTALWDELKLRSRKDKSHQTGLPALQIENRVDVLGRFVPGCRKISLPYLLDEATDYIAALELQVRAMTFIADLLAMTDRVDPSQS